MPLRSDIKKVLVIGSGPIVIGQAAEFDYAGTQACKALRQAGLEVVLINSNPATIMTDKAMADKIYIERAFYNVPFHDSTSSKKSYIHFAEMLKTHNPNIIYLKPHTGQSIRLGELTLDIMLTHEDLVIPESATSRCGDFNNTTTVIKFSAFGKSYLQLGDYSGSHSDGIEAIFLSLYKNGNAYPALQSDIVQVAHHALEGNQANVYKAIGARYAFIPQTDTDFDAEGVVMMKSTFQATVEQLYESNANAEIYLQSRYTHALTIAQDGTITHSQEPIRGANADYADLLATVPPYQK